MSTPLQKQKRLQIVLAIIIGLTIPCYGLGYIFVSVDRQTTPTITPSQTLPPTATWFPRVTDTPALVVPTRYPTFTPTLTATPTLTSTITQTPTLTPEPTETFTATVSPTYTDTPDSTPSDTPAITP